MKSEVYSWRVSTEVKTSLEREARRLKLSMSAALDQAARDWLERNRGDIESDAAQGRLHRAAADCFGAFASGDPHRSENVRRAVRERLRRRHDR